ncbi:hypothetical protein HDU86_002421 [Geranomyces michiganensis]|nr:hypothetical protein HDU86_002421 [Geranomyces michiganensis]
MVTLQSAVDNKVKLLHCISALFLASYDTVLHPSFEHEHMMKKRSKGPQSLVKGTIARISHAERLKLVMKLLESQGQQVTIVSETFSTRTCCSSGGLRNVGRKKRQINIDDSLETDLDDIDINDVEDDVFGSRTEEDLRFETFETEQSGDVPYPRSTTNTSPLSTFNNGTRRGKLRFWLNNRWVQRFFTAALLVSLVTMCLGTVDAVLVSRNHTRAVYSVEASCLIIFTIELVLQLACCRVLADAFEFQKAIDFLTVLPFYIDIGRAAYTGRTLYETTYEIEGGAWVRVLDLARLLRLFRLFPKSGKWFLGVAEDDGTGVYQYTLVANRYAEKRSFARIQRAERRRRRERQRQEHLARATHTSENSLVETFRNKVNNLKDFVSRGDSEDSQNDSLRFRRTMTAPVSSSKTIGGWDSTTPFRSKGKESESTLSRLVHGRPSAASSGAGSHELRVVAPEFARAPGVPSEVVPVLPTDDDPAQRRHPPRLLRQSSSTPDLLSLGRACAEPGMLASIDEPPSPQTKSILISHEPRVTWPAAGEAMIQIALDPGLRPEAIPARRDFQFLYNSDGSVSRIQMRYTEQTQIDEVIRALHAIVPR